MDTKNSSSWTNAAVQTWASQTLFAGMLHVYYFTFLSMITIRYLCINLNMTP